MKTWIESLTAEDIREHIRSHESQLVSLRMELIKRGEPEDDGIKGYVEG
jgi:hypothetical protein